MGDSTNKIPKVPHEQMDWEKVEQYLRETEDFWWLNEIETNGKKITQLEDLIETRLISFHAY